MDTGQEFQLAMNRILECNVIKYAAYRTAAKLRVLQRTLNTDRLRLGVVAGVFERHKLQCTENSVQLDSGELEALLSDIFFVLQKEAVYDLDVNRATRLALTFLFKVFDINNTGSVQVHSAKVGLIVLTESKPREKYQYLFGQLADHNSCLSRKKLEIMLKKLTYITEFLGESLSFGKDLIQATVESCFKKHFGTLGITEDGFLNWLLQDPQLLVWLSTLYRMQISEMVCHAAKCSVCKMYPIIGLRYRCLQCLSYNQCQTCFFTWKFNKKHKVKHPVQEYCCQITSTQSTRAFLTTIKNKFKKPNQKLQYLPANQQDELPLATYKSMTIGESTRLLDEMEVSTRTVLHGSRIFFEVNPQRELQNIITQLEQENKQLQIEIEKLSQLEKISSAAEGNSFNFKQCLNDHRSQVKTQLERLKLLKRHLMSQRMNNISQVQSTPLVATHKIKPIRKDLGGLSPISSELRSTNLSQKMVWDMYDLELHQTGLRLNASWEDLSYGHDDFLTRTCLTRQSVGASAYETPVLKQEETGKISGLSWLAETSSDNNSCTESNNDDQKKDLAKIELEELHDELEDVLNKLQDLLKTNTPASTEKIDEDSILERTTDQFETILNQLLVGVK